MELNIPETFYFSTVEPAFDNVDTMGLFINMLPLDTEILWDEGTYIEINYNGKIYGVHAGGDGDSFNHKITFEELPQ